MPKIEIELTDEQLERVKQLEERGIDVGQAIDMLFEIKNKALPEIEEFEREMGILDKVKQTALDINSKADFWDENYCEHEEKTPDMKIQEIKHNIRWSKDFFKF